MQENSGFHMITFYTFPFGFPSKDIHIINVCSDQTPDAITENKFENQKICCDLLLSLCVCISLSRMTGKTWAKSDSKFIFVKLELQSFVSYSLVPGLFLYWFSGFFFLQWLWIKITKNI